MKAYRRLLHIIGVVVGLCFGSIAVLIPFDMFLRAADLGSLPWLSEVVEYSIFIGVFLAAPWVLADNGHIKVDLLASALPGSAARKLERFLCVIGFVICASFVVIAVFGALDAHEFGAMIRRTLVIPEWWLLAVFAVAMALMCVEFLIRIFGDPIQPHPKHLVNTDV